MSNIIAFPTDRSSASRGNSKDKPGVGRTPPKPPIPTHPRYPEGRISSELTELAGLNRRLIALTDFLGQRITEQERRIHALERRLITLAKEVFKD